MHRNSLIAFTVLTLTALTICAGCVERTLTINTEPQDALVSLNDEEIGTSPVTVSFNWYGDYNVRITKPGFETLKTHRELKAPWYDSFPFDFFTLLSPERKVDLYVWTFELSTKKEVAREELIRNAQRMRGELY